MYILFYTYIPCRYIFSLELCWPCAIGGTWYSALHLWAAGWFQCNGMQWCNGNVVLRVELPSGCPVHDGMQSPAQSSMSVYDLMPVKWCLMISLRTSWRSLCLSRSFHFIKHIQDMLGTFRPGTGTSQISSPVLAWSKPFMVRDRRVARLHALASCS